MVFVQVTGQQNLLSRPFQLALTFTIVPYGANILESENLTWTQWGQNNGPWWINLPLKWHCKIYEQQLWLHIPECYNGQNNGHFIHKVCIFVSLKIFINVSNPSLGMSLPLVNKHFNIIHFCNKYENNIKPLFQPKTHFSITLFGKISRSFHKSIPKKYILFILDNFVISIDRGLTKQQAHGLVITSLINVKRSHAYWADLT